jgi:hypothetical protein
MKRPYTATEAETMLKEMYELGMVVCIDFIVGYPTESEEDFKQTLGFMSRVNKYVTNMSIAPYCNVYKNDLASQPEKYGIHALNGGGNTWESAYSTPSIRAHRYEATIAHLASLRISHRYSDSDRTFFENLLKKNT